MEKVTLRNMFELSTLSELGEDDIELLMSEIGDKVDNYILVNDNFEREIERLKSIKKIIENKIKKENPIIDNYIEFLCSIIKDFPTKRIFFNQPLFTKQIKREFIQVVEYKLTEDDCKMIIDNYKSALELIEEKMSSTMLFTHKNKFK